MVSSPVPVDANRPHVVGVLVSADQQTLPVGRQQLRLHANGILRAAHATQEAHLSGPGVDRGELEGAVLGQQRVERRQAVTVGQDVALRLGLLQVHRRLASGDVDPEHVDEHRLPFHPPGRRRTPRRRSARGGCLESVPRSSRRQSGADGVVCGRCAPRRAHGRRAPSSGRPALRIRRNILPSRHRQPDMSDWRCWRVRVLGRCDESNRTQLRLRL
jgi:hypothetical protein